MIAAGLGSPTHLAEPGGSSFVLLLIPLAIGLAIAVRLFVGALDKERIRSELARRSATLLHCRWSPFGRGWFGEKGERIYRVSYRDRYGNRHRAFAKTSLFSGVYFSDDEVVGSPRERDRPKRRIRRKAPSTRKRSRPRHRVTEREEEARDLAAENAHLRRRLAELEEKFEKWSDRDGVR